jgi:HSP20 family protein
MYLPRDVLKDLLYFHDRINYLFEEHLQGLSPTLAEADLDTWSPAVDIYESEEAFHLTAELPGVSLANVRIEVTGGAVTLSGERPFPPPGLKKEECQRLEGGYGSFARSFSLPMPVVGDGVRAALKDGVLRVTLPKAAGRGATTIPISEF